MSLHTYSLYNSETVSIHDVSCSPEFREHGPKEYSEEARIVFPRSGVFIKQIAGLEFVADPVHVLFFNPFESYRIAHPVDGGDHCTAFAYSTELLREVIGLYQPAVIDRASQIFEFTHAPSDHRIFFFQQRLRQYLLSCDNDILMIDEFAMRMLATLIGQTYLNRGIRSLRGRASTVQNHRELAERTQLLLSQRFTENLSLTQIANEVQSSTFHLARTFQRQTGLAIHHYRNRLRLRTALEKLAEYKNDLTALALNVGFSSHSHFSDVFRQTFGMPPSECRHRNASDMVSQLSKNLEVCKETLA